MVQPNRVYLAQSNFNFITNALLLLPLLTFKPINLPPKGQDPTLHRGGKKEESANQAMVTAEGRNIETI